MFGRGGFGHHGCHGRRGHWGQGQGQNCGDKFFEKREKDENKDCWRAKRAKVVSVPDEVLVGEPGETIMATIDYVNNTHKTFKPLTTFNSKSSDIFENVEIQVSDSTPFQTHSLLIPIKIKETAKLTSEGDEDHHVASFSFQGPGGW